MIGEYWVVEGDGEFHRERARSSKEHGGIFFILIFVSPPVFISYESEYPAKLKTFKGSDY